MHVKKKILSSLLLIPFLGFSLSFAEPNQKRPEEEAVKIDLQKVSQAFGHLIGKHLSSHEFEFDGEEVVKGMQDSLAGKESPMNETECIQAISIVQEREFEKRAAKNLEEANAFMAKNAKEKGIVILEKDRLHCKIESEGKGSIVEKHFSPIIRYSGKCLDGKIFGESQEEEAISLDETIPGFARGIIGMREGEKRTLYIHPELGYGKTSYLPPNSVLVFDVEVVKANRLPEQEVALSPASHENLDETASKIVEKALR